MQLRQTIESVIVFAIPERVLFECDFCVAKFKDFHPQGGDAHVAEAKEIFGKLQIEDPIRAKYWSWRAAGAK